MHFLHCSLKIMTTLNQTVEFYFKINILKLSGIVEYRADTVYS